MSRITDEQAAYLLCCAFEGGSNCWYMINNVVNPKVVATPLGKDEYHPKYISYPFSENGAVIIVEDDKEQGPYFRLDLAAIARGKHIMENDPQYTRHYVNVLTNDFDAETGDVFLQLCLFGEIVYG